MELLVAALVTVIAVQVVAIAWLLRPGPRRGGMLDLTPAAAAGELDLSWDDPRPRGILTVRDAADIDVDSLARRGIEVRERISGNGDDLRFPTSSAA